MAKKIVPKRMIEDEDAPRKSRAGFLMSKRPGVVSNSGWIKRVQKAWKEGTRPHTMREEQLRKWVKDSKPKKSAKALPAKKKAGRKSIGSRIPGSVLRRTGGASKSRSK